MKIEPPKPILKEVLSSYMEAKNVKVGCPHCPSHEWLLLESKDARGAFVQAIGDDGSEGKGVLALLPLLCNNCGYVWVISRKMVEDWMLSQEPKKAGEEDGNEQNR